MRGRTCRIVALGRCIGVALSITACGSNTNAPVHGGTPAGDDRPAKDAGPGAGGAISAGGSGGGGGTGDPGNEGNDAAAGAGGDAPSGGAGGIDGGASLGGERFGEVITGQYNLGPVDFAETQWHNACAPEGGYPSDLRDETGLGQEYLVGVSSENSRGGAVCDACVSIETDMGRSMLARVVTYGVSKAAGDLDVSPSVYAALNMDEYPRAMHWQFAMCPETGPLRYDFQAAASAYWTSLWVRNPRVPITKVEVKSANHSGYFELRREADGTLNDDAGFGEGAFTLRLTAMNGQTIEDGFPRFSGGQTLISKQQFK